MAKLGLQATVSLGSEINTSTAAAATSDVALTAVMCISVRSKHRGFLQVSQCSEILNIGQQRTSNECFPEHHGVEGTTE